jgi:MSHA biogenesis protein MshI
MLELFKRKNNHLRLGLSLDRDGLLLMVLDVAKEKQPQVKELMHFPISKKTDPDEIIKIKRAIRQKKLHKIPCFGLLKEKYYQLLLIEPLNVPEEEMREAMLWKIKDLVGLDVENTVIDTFYQPDKKMIYTVAAKKDEIAETTRLIHQLELALVSLDIEELAFRNYFDLYPEAEQGIAVVEIKNGEGKLLIIRQGCLYLCRRFSLNYSNQADGPLPEEDIVLEIQRSIDYYERQMGQVAPAKIIFCGIDNEDKVTSVIRDSFQQTISCLQVEGLNVREKDSELWTNEKIALIAGAGLRSEVA